MFRGSNMNNSFRAGATIANIASGALGVYGYKRGKEKKSWKQRSLKQKIGMTAAVAGTWGGGVGYLLGRKERCGPGQKWSGKEAKCVAKNVK